jgi:hypothetical protein
MRKVSRKKAISTLNQFRGEIVGRFAVIEWCVNVIISNYIGEVGYPITMSMLESTNISKKLSYLDHFVTKFNIMSSEHRSGLFNEMERLRKIRNAFAHSMATFPKLSDYRHLEYFEFKSMGKLDHDDLKVMRYKISDHSKNLKNIESVISLLMKIRDAQEKPQSYNKKSRSKAKATETTFNFETL